MTRTAFQLLGAAAVLFAATAAPQAFAQAQMGTGAYSFPAGNSTFAAQAQMSRKLNSSSGSTSGMSALTEYIYNSSSTSIGNYNSVNVGDNSQATVSSGQTSKGNQGSTATTDVTVKNTLTSTTNNGTPAQ